MTIAYVQEGGVARYTATAASVSAGDVVVMNSLIGIALNDIAQGSTGEVAIRGIFRVPKVKTDEIDLGEEVAYIVGSSKFGSVPVTPAAGDIAGSCISMGFYDDEAETMLVKLNIGLGLIATSGAW